MGGVVRICPALVGLANGPHHFLIKEIIMTTRRKIAHGMVKPELREALELMYKAFHVFNRRHFESKLREPVILFKPAFEMICNDYYVMGTATVDGVMVTITDEVFTYTNYHRNYALAQGVLLHEMIHLKGIKGHGLLFARECNRIGKTMLKPPVQVSDCNSWLGTINYYFTYEDKKFIAEHIKKYEQHEKQKIVLSQVNMLKEKIEHIKSKTTKREFTELENVISEYLYWEKSK